LMEKRGKLPSEKPQKKEYPQKKRDHSLVYEGEGVFSKKNRMFSEEEGERSSPKKVREKEVEKKESRLKEEDSSMLALKGELGPCRGGEKKEKTSARGGRKSKGRLERKRA